NGTEYACCFARDIREQKLAELVLRESEQRLQSILDNSPAAIYLKDPQGRYLLVNCQYERSCHVTQEQIVGKTDYEIFPKEIADRIVSNDKRVLEAGQALEFEEAILLPDGMHIFISQKFLLYDSTGMSYGVCSISTDITKRIQTEESLRDSQRFIQQITDTAPTMIYIFNPNQMRNTYLNRYGIDFFGKTPQEIRTLGKQFFVEVLHPDDLWKLDELNERFAKAEDGEILENEFRMRNAKGEWRWLHASDIVLSRTEAGLPEQILGTAIDITEQKQTEEIRHAWQAEKALRRFQLHFFSRVSHEFRTPLSTILGSAQILESSSESWSGSKLLRNIQRIKSAAKHLTQLLDDILTLNRAEAGKLDIHPQPIEIEKFCQRLVEEMRIQANSQISLNFSSESRAKQVICDEKLLRSILTNLIANALKYSPQGSEVEVVLTNEEEAVILQVKDHGIGIPQDDQNHLFELFYRGKNVENIPGTGLGLSVVKKCLDLQGGKIAIASEVGKGTTAIVTIPIHPATVTIPHDRS
ncbi:MAG TPA: ATP-binding protein, partial [Allocoleopsis sp.]